MQWPQLGNGKDTEEFYQTVGCPSFIAQHLINDCYYPSAQSRVQIMCKYSAIFYSYLTVGYFVP